MPDLAESHALLVLLEGKEEGAGGAFLHTRREPTPAVLGPKMSIITVFRYNFFFEDSLNFFCNNNLQHPSISHHRRVKAPNLVITLFSSLARSNM